MEPSLLLLLPSVLILSTVWGDQPASNIHGGKMTTGPLEGVDTILVVRCSWPTSNRDVVGVTLFDMDNKSIYVDAQIEPINCKTNNVLGECIINPDHETILKAVVSGLQEGQPRNFGCNGTYFDNKFSQEQMNITVSLNGPNEHKVAYIEAATPLWVYIVLPLLVILSLVLTGIILWMRFCRGRAQTEVPFGSFAVARENGNHAARSAYFMQTSNSMPEFTALIHEDSDTRSLNHPVRHGSVLISEDSGFPQAMVRSQRSLFPPATLSNPQHMKRNRRQIQWSQFLSKQAVG